MNILISGLTLHNNKGGPALALSLKKVLESQFKNSKFYLLVPNFANNISLENKWAETYGFDGISGSIGAKELLFINRKNRKEFLEFLKQYSIDLIVDLTALSYMDIPHLSYKKNITRNLSIYSLRYFANKLEIPMIRWTQSYGPFRSIFTKLIVKSDLKHQKNIFVRGEQSFDNMKELFDEKRLFSFPDVAILLDFKDDYYNNHLKNKKYITLSPSSVIYTKEKEKHIQHFRQIIKYLNDLDYQVVIVPHNLMSIKPNINNCDLEVARKIVEKINESNIHIVKENIDVYNLKGIISNAQLHIGARYHSIIASLSTGVPTIAFSWHEKYQDIMKMYLMEKFVYDGKQDIDILFVHINKLLEEREKMKLILNTQQILLKKYLKNNTTLFMENYYEM